MQSLPVAHRVDVRMCVQIRKCIQKLGKPKSIVYVIIILRCGSYTCECGAQSLRVISNGDRGSGGGDGVCVCRSEGFNGFCVEHLVYFLFF